MESCDSQSCGIKVSTARSNRRKQSKPLTRYHHSTDNRIQSLWTRRQGAEYILKVQSAWKIATFYLSARPDQVFYWFIKCPWHVRDLILLSKILTVSFMILFAMPRILHKLRILQLLQERVFLFHFHSISEYLLAWFNSMHHFLR